MRGMMPAGRRGSVFATLTSLASLFAALSCCLPLGTLAMAAGSASVSVFSERLRPWLLGLSVAALLVAFIQTYARGYCAFRFRRLRTVLLWFSAVVVAGMLVFPRAISTALAGQNPWAAPTSALHTFNSSEFARDFNAAAGFTRVVILLSPT